MIALRTADLPGAACVDADPDLMTTAEVAQFLGVKEQTVAFWRRTGRLAAARPPTGRWPGLFDRQTVERFREIRKIRRRRDVDLAPIADERFRARFWSKVNKDGPIPAHCPELGPCWTWTAGSHRLGYGLFTFGEGNSHLAHIASYALTKGIVPAGSHVCHRCDNPPCVRPDHLFLGTARDNALDMLAKGREGSRHPGMERQNARLADDQVRAIRAVPPYFGRNTHLAREYGVSTTTIRKIINGEKWRHVA